MAKNQGIDPKAATAARIKRTEAYAEKVRLLFAQTVNDILALNKTMPKLDDGVMFSFDGESLKKQKEVEALLRRLHSSVTMAIRECVRLEWAQANAEADRLIKSVFGQRVLDSPEFTAWTQRNTAARDAFLARSEKGLNLSDRVWKSVRQLRDEMEVAVTVSMGEGKSASAMSREVRQYLNDPDLMFRRFRYKKGDDADGNPIYGRKWKKRIKDEATGKYKWIDYDMDSYRTGHGVYKSSAKNAMRLTRTETNIAYRRADHERWQQMDFVLGQRVQLSKNHPKPDICDKLQGDYPKDFVFDGWHPQCYSDDSEVLTADGWKFFKDVCDDDMILSLNPDTRNVEYVGVIDRQRYEKHGVMQHFFNRSLDCLVTDEHQMVYLNKSDGAIKRCRADEYRQGKGAFYRGCEYQSIIVNKTKTICEYTIAFDDYCEFMGYWLADGSLERHSGIHIAKKMGLPLRNDIIACIERMGFSPKERENGIVFYNTEINAFLEAFGRAHDKFIPSDILNATRSQIGVFLNAFIACDGHVRNGKPFVGNRGSKFEPSVQERLYYTTSPKMSGQLGELILKIGKRPSYAIQKASTTVKKDGKAIKGNHDCWKIAECNSVTATVFSKEFVQYDGFVYDLSLERNHIMYVRRNGKCFWGSNCFCFVTPILVDAEEMAKVNEAFLKGEKYIPKGKRITEYPDNFKDWVAEHAEDIQAARKRGTEPYFIRENAAIVDRFMGDAAPEPMKVRYVPDGLEKGQRKAWIDNSRETAEAIGVVQGEPMAFDEANELRGNPHYEAGTASGYTTNCQCAVVANELRRRGFDVEALPNIGTKGSVPYRLSRQTELAWIDPTTGEAPKKAECNEIKHVGKGWKVRSKGLSIEQITENIDNATRQPGRYHIDFTWKGTGEGHVITVERLADGKLRFYDPQTGKVVSWVKDYSARVSTVGSVSVLRVDGLMSNPEIVKEAVVKAGTAKSAMAAAGIVVKGGVKGDSETLAKRMLKWGMENIIGKYTFTHPAFKGKAAIFSRKSFTKNLGNGELGEVKADILMNIKSYLKPDMEMVYRPSTHGDNNGVFVATSKYTGDLGQFKGREFELQFRISNNGDIVFYCIKLLT